MENDSNNKSQTGGLKLMTVFIAVLALHVVVIGGFTVYHLMSGGSTDVDLTTTDKSHKSTDGTSITETTMPDASQGDKSTASAPTEVASIPANSTTPAPDATASAAPAAAPTPAATTTTPATGTTVTPTASTMAATAPAPAATPETPAPAPTPAPAMTPPPSLTLTAPSQVPSVASSDMVNENSQTPTGPISPSLAPPPDVAPSLNGPLSAGPVHMPAANSSSALAKAERVHQREHEEVYTVKITDSYKKIAHAHHVTVAELKDANGIKNNVLHTGQKLIIPSEKKYVAESASTSTLDAAPTAQVPSTVAAPMTTGLATTTTTTPAVASAGLHHHLYTIVKGDTLTKIARKFKTTPSAIMAANDITDPTKLAIGKKLRIPSRESRSAQNVAPATTVQPSQVQSQPKPTATDGQLANFVP